MSKLGIDTNSNVIQAMKQGTVQNVTYTGTAGLSSAFNGATTLIRLCSDQDCFYLIASSPTATTSNGSRLPAGVVDFVPVLPGQKISVVQSTAGGTLNITEGSP